MSLTNTQKIALLTKELNPENTHYYEELAESIISQSKLDSTQKKQLLLEILQEMIQLQNEGSTIKNSFDDEPRISAEHLLNGFLMRQKKKATITRFLFLLFISFVQYGLFNTLIEPVITISLFKTGVPIILLILATFFLFKTFKTGLSFKKIHGKQLLFPLLTGLCWLGFVLIPLIDTKINGFNVNGILSHQTLALFLFIFSSICLFVQIQQKISYTLIGITIFFMVFDVFVFIGTIQPIYLPTTSKTMVSLLLLLIISIGPFFEQNMKKRLN
ncbi:hypothetical protein ACYSNW_09165 [Enterococcus sp. LJL99]